MISKFIDWLFYRNRRTMTGVYQSGVIFPHQIHPPVMVAARVQRRLENTDRVSFVAVEARDGVPEARRVRVYRRPQRR
jgi:hypothetical protein